MTVIIYPGRVYYCRHCVVCRTRHGGPFRQGTHYAAEKSDGNQARSLRPFNRHSFIVHDGKLECFRVFPQTSGCRLFATVSFLGRLNSLALDIIIVMLRQSALWLYFFVGCATHKKAACFIEHERAASSEQNRWQPRHTDVQPPTLDSPSIKTSTTCCCSANIIIIKRPFLFCPFFPGVV